MGGMSCYSLDLRISIDIRAVMGSAVLVATDILLNHIICD